MATTTTTTGPPAAPTMNDQYAGMEKGRAQANDLLSKHVPAEFQNTTWNIAPAPLNTHGNHWGHSFWDCFAPPDLCLTGCLCPCFLFGRTQSRMRGHRQPGLFNVDVDCAVWCGLYLLGGWQGIYQTIKRIDMRERLGVEGSAPMDCLASCCCPCCGLIQEEKESLLKQEAIDAKLQGYTAPQGMSYP